MPETDDVLLKKGEYMCRIHKQPRNTLFWPSDRDPALEGMWLENWRKTIRSDTKECVVHQPLSNPTCHHASWGEEPWKGESQFRIRARRTPPASTTATPADSMQAARNGVEQNTEGQSSEESKKENAPQEVRQEPYARTILANIRLWSSSGSSRY